MCAYQGPEAKRRAESEIEIETEKLTQWAKSRCDNNANGGALRILQKQWEGSKLPK